MQSWRTLHSHREEFDFFLMEIGYSVGVLDQKYLGLNVGPNNICDYIQGLASKSQFSHFRSTGY